MAERPKYMTTVGFAVEFLGGLAATRPLSDDDREALDAQIAADRERDRADAHERDELAAEYARTRGDDDD